MIKASVQFHFYPHTAEDERLEQHQLREFKLGKFLANLSKKNKKQAKCTIFNVWFYQQSW